MLPRAADLPDSLVRLVPVLLQEVKQLPLQAPAVLVEVEPGLPAQCQGVYDLAVDVELTLVDGGVADPDRGGPFLAR